VPIGSEKVWQRQTTTLSANEVPRELIPMYLLIHSCLNFAKVPKLWQVVFFVIFKSRKEKA